MEVYTMILKKVLTNFLTNFLNKIKAKMLILAKIQQKILKTKKPLFASVYAGFSGYK